MKMSHENKETEENAKNEKIEELEKYKELFDNLLDVIIIIQDGKIVFSNREFDAMTGYSQDEIIGEEFTTFIPPDMREILMAMYQKRMMGFSVPRKHIIQILRKDGKRLWAQVKATVIDWQGKKADMVSLTDITQLKNMQDKLILVGIFLREIRLASNEDEIYQEIVDFLCDVLGFRRVAILKNEGNTLKVVKARGYEDTEIKLPLNGKGITVWVARNNTPYYAPNVDNEKIYLKVDEITKCEYATPISLGDRVYGVIDVQSEEIDGISGDDRILIDMLGMHLALLLRDDERKKNLEAARDINELMLHLVGHDLKNPLAVIMGYANLLEENFKKEYVKNIENAVSEAESIIRKAITFSKVSMGNINQEKKNINLRKMIMESARLVAEKYKNATIHIPNQDAYVIGYPLIGEVFVNLLDNAFKYGASEVWIGFEEGDNLKIRVADNGIGIPRKISDEIFVKFKKFKKSGQGSYGLGLSIVKRIVEMHNGRIWVEDNKPKGSVFVIELPNA